MKTIGERIKQAREQLGWSGEHLAKLVGYKTQSGISNLEQRATGSGGNKIGQIAKALNVPLDWLVNGPDSDKVPFLPAKQSNYSNDSTVVPLMAAQESGARQYDSITTQVLAIFAKFDTAQKAAALALLKQYEAVLGSHQDGQAL